MPWRQPDLPAKLDILSLGLQIECDDPDWDVEHKLQHIAHVTSVARSDCRQSARRRAAAAGRGLHDRCQRPKAGRLTRRGRPAAVRQLDDFLAPPRPRTLD